MRKNEGAVVSFPESGSVRPDVRFVRHRWQAWLALTACTIVLVLIGGGQALAGSKKPNLIIVVSDDQGVDAIEGANWPNDLNVRTPTLSTLADRGRVFTNARVNAACSPTRAALMTGRSAFQTGVTGVIGLAQPLPNRDLVSLHTSERTIAEVLQDAGYYTVLVDKWHLGWSDEAGTNPEQQGFDRFIDYNDFKGLDDPLVTGDEHITRSVDNAIDAIVNRPDPGQPYALFFWSIDPHKRVDHTGREPLLWWKVRNELLPSGENYYETGRDNDRNRYRAVVEALDTELNRLLRSLNVINSNLEYVPGSNSVVFYMSDNGTPAEVAPDPNKAKHTLFEGGIRVPFFVFGEQVPQDGNWVNRRIAVVDLFDTICDIVEMPEEFRGDRPRTGISFADDIGWRTDPLPEHKYHMSSRRVPENLQHEVTLIGSRYKLVTNGGNLGLTEPAPDRFYDLLNDPEETVDLLTTNMTSSQRATYRQMLNDVADYWPSAVGAPSTIQVDVPATHVLSIDSLGRRSSEVLTVGHDIPEGPLDRLEARALIRFDIASIPGLMPPNRKLRDIIGAQVIVRFQSDSNAPADTETAPVFILPVTTAWMDNPNLGWSDIVNAFGQTSFGAVDIAPHIIPDPGGNLSGVPLTPNTPISFGTRSDIMPLLRRWFEQPSTNNGIMLFADPYDDLPGNQQVNFQATGAVLRLVLRNPQAQP